jgi:tetratricopeptide (TPR) repeat protein
MKCRCLSDTASDMATIVDHVRLFPRQANVRWKYRVHEQILPALRAIGAEICATDVTINHVGYQDAALRGRKRLRDLRLLQQDMAENPDDPFILFNLGWSHEDVGEPELALPYLRRSLQRSSPSDSIVRKLFSLIADCHRQLGEPHKALQVCHEGRRYYPDDAQLLFVEALLRREQRDHAGAARTLEYLLAGTESPHFSSVVDGVRGHMARHNLAVIYREMGKVNEAEAQWKQVVADQPNYVQGWLGLGELYIDQSRFQEAMRVLGHLENQGSRSRPDVIAFGSRLRSATMNDREATKGLALFQQSGANGTAGPGSHTLAELYHRSCVTPSDINEHLPVLFGLAKDCRHVTEFGTRTGNSTLAFLAARPEKLVCYDQVRFPQVDVLAALAGPVGFEFHRADVLARQIEETDLLFIDTWHVYKQLKEELRLHAEKVRRYIVLHDTTTFGEKGETEGHRGLWPAVQEFVAHGEFRLKARYENNNGLTVLERVKRA